MTKLERLRVDALLSVKDLSAATGVDAGAIRRLENGKTRRPSMKNLGPLAQHFKVPASSLLDDERDHVPSAA